MASRAIAVMRMAGGSRLAADSLKHAVARAGSGPHGRGHPWFTLVPARGVAHLRRARGQLMTGVGAARSESGKSCGVKAARVKDIFVLPPFWFWPVIAAPFVGSFLGVVVTRARVPPSILVGRSACDPCGQRLGAAHRGRRASGLAPRGRCRVSAQSIGGFSPAIRLASTG